MKMRSGGGFKAIAYSLKLASRVGPVRFFKAMSTKNTCKTCAVGMGGQLGGMVNEGGHFPEVCKKSFQAMASDMQPAIPEPFWQKNDFNMLRAMTPRQLETSGRIVKPLYAAAGDTHYRTIEWDEAITKIADKMKAAGPERSFFYASGRSSNEAGFLLQLLARQLGTNYVNNCSYYCHQASGVGLATTIGSGVGTIKLEDLDHCDLYLLVGANPASNHPRLMRTMMEIRRRGGDVIVINPAKELGLVNFRVPSDVRSLLFGSQIASEYVQPHIGGDMALLVGLAKVVLQRKAEDQAFIDRSTEGYAEFKRNVESTDWDTIVRESGVNRETIEKIGATFCWAKNVVIAWAMGITHHTFGSNNVQMLANLAMMRGMVGRPKAGLMPIRGHSNVQGVGSVGVTPQLKQYMLERFEQTCGFAPPTSPGYDTMQCMEAADRGEMDFAFNLGGNLYGSNPDSEFAERALSRVGLVAYLSTTLNTGHAHGLGQETIVLPVLPRDEEQQPTTQESMFSFVRLSNGGKARFDGPRSEVSILAAIGEKVLGNAPVNWAGFEDHQQVRAMIADMIPGYQAIKDIGKTQGKKKGETEFHIEGRHPREGVFTTDTGKAKFFANPLPELPHANGQLRMMTIRSEGQFNTVVYDEEDLYRHQTRRDIILMNPADIAERGWKEDQPVRISSDTGEMRYMKVRAFDVRAGNCLMYCPEANVLVSKEVDPKSKTPSFKLTMVSVEAEA